MAELEPPPLTAPRWGTQLAAIARVRWQLTVNSVRTTRGALEMVARIWVGFWFAVMGLAGAFGFGVGGWYFLGHGRGEWIAAMLWPLLLFWQVFPLATSAFAEHADSSQFLRYPLGYRAYVVVRVAFGALDAATLVGILCLLGLTAGCAIAAPRLAPLILLLAIAFLVFNLLLAQMIFAWLEHWLARRRTREILSVLFLLLVFGVNFLRPLTRGAVHLTVPAQWAGLVAAQRWLPPGLPAHALAAAAAGQAWTLAAAVVLLAAWVGGVLALLSRRLRADYRGETLSEGVPGAPRREKKQSRAAAAAAPARVWSGLSGPVPAIAQKELRYLARSPMMYFPLVMPVLLLVFFRFGSLNGAPGHHAANLAGFGFPVGAAYALLVLTNLIFNCLGTDAVGAQFYYMAPVRFRQVFLGKNLAYGLLLAGEVVVIYLAACLLDGPPAVWLTAATLVGMVFAALCNFSCGNLLSLSMPKKIDLSRLGRQGSRGVSSLVALAIQGGVAALAGIAVLIAYLLGRLWLLPLFLAVEAVLALVAYRVTLGLTDRLALSSREALIEELSKG